MLYATNVWFIGFYISNKVPGLFAIDASLPRPKDEEYLWEKTAGMGIVPKWVSWIGIAAIDSLLGHLFGWLSGSGQSEQVCLLFGQVPDQVAEIVENQLLNCQISASRVET